MNNKMTTNSQLLTNEPKRKEKENNKKTKKTKTKQTTRRGTESEKWTSYRGSSVGMGKGGVGGEKAQGRRSIISRHKIDRER